MQVKELKNGRLAMFSMFGFFVQAIVTGKVCLCATTGTLPGLSKSVSLLMQSLDSVVILRCIRASSQGPLENLADHLSDPGTIACGPRTRLAAETCGLCVKRYICAIH